MWNNTKPTKQQNTDMGYYMRNYLFPPGNVSVTPEVKALAINVLNFLHRHCSGDFGIADEFTYVMNHRSIQSGKEVASQYLVDVGAGTGYLSIVTELDQSCTIVFLTSEKLLDTAATGAANQKE